MKYLIEGGNSLNGKIVISGNKNSVFPCIAASLLTDQPVTLENIPDIKDTQVLLEILEDLGVEVSRQNNNLTITATSLKKELSKDLMSKLRGSIVLAGALLGRLGDVIFYHPGGDIIGKRSITAHLEGFKALGADVRIDDLNFQVSYNKKKELPKNPDFYLTEKSVTGTENLILAAATYSTTVTLRNCAIEPHIVDLCNLLTLMGVKITGIGTDTLQIEGKPKLGGATFRIRSDYIEVGTYAIAAAITRGELTLEGLDDTDLTPILNPLSQFGVLFQQQDNKLTVTTKHLKAIDKLVTNVWPGFPTDLMSPVIVLATQARGVTLCHDWMYESRMFFVDKLISMGAAITISDPHRVLVSGATHLKARELETADIRAGMALVLAALVAKGKSVIHRVELIERGYEDPTRKLLAVGANITKIE